MKNKYYNNISKKDEKDKLSFTISSTELKVPNKLHLSIQQKFKSHLFISKKKKDAKYKNNYKGENNYEE